MRIEKVSVYDPIVSRLGREIPARVEILIDRLDDEDPRPQRHSDGWVIWHFGSDVYRFTNESEETLAWRDVWDLDGDLVREPFEGGLNTTGILTQPLVPVTFAYIDGHELLDYYVPVRYGDQLLKQATHPVGAKWKWVPDPQYARSGLLKFNLVLDYDGPNTLHDQYLRHIDADSQQLPPAEPERGP